MVTRVVDPPPSVVPLLALGGLFLVLWQARFRVRAAGLAPIAAGLLIWAQVDRPALLISGEGGLMGLMTPEGRALSKPKGQGFAAQSWLEDDGDFADQETAAQRPGFERASGEVVASVAGLTIRQFHGAGAAGRATAACGARATLIVVTTKARPPTGCALYDADAMALTGPMSVRAGPEGPVITTVRDYAGDRIWMRFLPPAPEVELPPLAELVANR
jgi:competence protein ComEC